MKNLKKMLTLCSLVLVFTLVFVSMSYAAGGSVMEVASDKAVNVFKHIKTIIFIVGGFGLIYIFKL